MVSDFIINKCSYNIPFLKNRVYVYDSSVLQYINVDNGLDGAMVLSTPTLITGFSISYTEEASLDERYKFIKTLRISLNDKINVNDVFDEKFYIVVEDYDGNLYLTNPDFLYKYTYVYNLSEGVNQTDITFQTSSNFPLLKIAITPPVYNECKAYRFTSIKTLQMVEKKYASYDMDDSILHITEPLKRVDFLKNTLSFQEQYDGQKVTSTIKFQMPLNSALASWDYDLLEFKDNIYTAVITTNDDYQLLTGIYTGLQPSYAISASMTEENNYEITLTEASNNGSIAVYLTTEEMGYTWEYIRILDGHKAYDCNTSRLGCGWAQIIVQAEVDNFGNKTGRYKLLEDIYDGLFNQDDPDVDYSYYDDNYGWLRVHNIIGTFEDDFPNNWFPTNECACYNPQSGCTLTTDMLAIINFQGTGTTSYTFEASCDWSINDVPSGITISPTTGTANTEYTLTISNSDDTVRQEEFRVGCCGTNKIFNISVAEETPCIDETYKYINCNGQTVQFKIKDGCDVTVNYIDAGLMYDITNGIIYINVPANDSQTSKTYYIQITCCGDDDTLTINQSPKYVHWFDNGYICDDGDKYVRQQLYTGTSYNDLEPVEEYRKTTLIEEGSADCRNFLRYSFLGHYICIDGSKYELLEEEYSLDNETWETTGIVRLGNWVEDESSFCEGDISYKWVLTNLTVCEE